MSFIPGKPKTGGRQAGTPNRLTGLFREAVLCVYERLGGHDAFLQWARENPTEYYKIAARLIPTEMREDDGSKSVTVIVQRSGHSVPEAGLALSLGGPSTL
jgi:hypothetical protein